MADYTINLEQLRAAIEVTEGAGTTPTRILSTGPAGNVDASDVRKRETIEDRGGRTRTSLRGTYSGIETSVLRISNIPASYEETGWWLSLLAPTGGGIPGTVDTSAYTRTWTPTEGTTTNTYGTGYYTAAVQYSSLDFSGTLVEKIPAMAVSSLTWNFNKRASGTDTGCTMDVELTSTQGTVTAGTAFDGALSVSTPTLILGNQLTASVDAASTAFGVTNDDQIMSASFTLTNPITWHYGMDGTNAVTSGHWAQPWTPSMTIVRRFSDLTELNGYVNKTTRAIRIAAEGDIVGATTATNQVWFDFIGKPTDHRRTQIDGLYYAEISLEAIFDSTLTTSWEVFCRNNVAAAYTAT